MRLQVGEDGLAFFPQGSDRGREAGLERFGSRPLVPYACQSVVDNGQRHDPGAHAEGEELEPDSWQAVLRMLMERTGISGTGGPRDEVS